jgi:hypothetical protein
MAQSWNFEEDLLTNIETQNIIKLRGVSLKDNPEKCQLFSRLSKTCTVLSIGGVFENERYTSTR